jgi:HEPN domain-containing protein
MFEQIFQAFEFAIKEKICFSHIDKIIEHDIRAIIVNMNRKQIKNKFNVHSLCVFRI